ncbi:hypothetical protein B0H14DRAFT_2642715 [Mycena olivaceomarginata]|nr:hypothetical protein B0H14DRAFT_2642715 [Mycena olivaceomarginata]
MPPMSLAELKQKLAAFKDHIKHRRDNLAEQQEKISAADEAWLDNDGNHVEEDAVIYYRLENSSDYERALSRLDKEADVIERPKGFAEGLGKKIEKVADTEQQTKKCGL